MEGSKNKRDNLLYIIIKKTRLIYVLTGTTTKKKSLKASNILVDENLWTQLGGMECSMDLEDLGKLSGEYSSFSYLHEEDILTQTKY